MGEIMTVAEAAAREAGAFLLERFGRIQRIDSKADKTLVTDVDRGAERIIVDRIKSVFPDHGIMAEESGKTNCGGEYMWVIDPLDGTHNFIRQVVPFGMCIGVTRNEEFVGGVIFMPTANELYAAEKGAGAYKNGEPIHVSSVAKLGDSSFILDSSYRRNPDLMRAAYAAFGARVFNMRMWGSSARNLSFIAEGKAEGVFELHDTLWDFAAGVCLIQEAGGAFSGMRGEPVTPHTSGFIASNGLVHQEIADTLAEIL